MRQWTRTPEDCLPHAIMLHRHQFSIIIIARLGCSLGFAPCHVGQGSPNKDVPQDSWCVPYDISFDTTAGNRAETGRMTHAGDFFFCELRAQWHKPCLVCATAAQMWKLPVPLNFSVDTIFIQCRPLITCVVGAASL